MKKSFGVFSIAQFQERRNFKDLNLLRQTEGKIVATLSILPSPLQCVH